MRRAFFGQKPDLIYGAMLATRTLDIFLHRRSLSSKTPMVLVKSDAFWNLGDHEREEDRLSNGWLPPSIALICRNSFIPERQGNALSVQANSSAMLICLRVLSNQETKEMQDAGEGGSGMYQAFICLQNVLMLLYQQ